MKIRYICDDKRHLICVPYSIHNLHIMAKQLDLDKNLFYVNHYDFPEKRRKEIEKKCQKISSQEMVEIIKNPKYAEIILSEEVKLGTRQIDYFLITQIQYDGVDINN